MYEALDIAKYIISKCINDCQPISNLQLQKILYYVQKEFLKNASVAFSESVEAWQFGPVIPDVYDYYSGFGSMPILIDYPFQEIDSDSRKIIDKIVEEKRILNPWDMVNETHKPNGAWDQIYKNGAGNHCIIPLELIRTVG